MNACERTPCGILRSSHVGTTITLAGWVDSLRDHGEVLFIHLRDRSGVVQIVFRPESTPFEVCEQAAFLRNEFCVSVQGQVVSRELGTENPHIDSGQIEVVASALTVLNKSETLPFPISEKSMVAGARPQGEEAINEDLRLQYRYLDLRRPSMQERLIRRHQITACVRRYLDEQGFVEVETPMLTKSTPEGARDYLVPSRHHPGAFYALPQSPQLFKQLLMVSGLERYYQIVRCFRDEDLRPNRQPEFTQLDLEASFIDEEFIYTLFEELAVRMFAVGGISLPRPFPRMTWKEAVETFGTDRPDLRFGMTFVDATDVFSHTSYSIFRRILDRRGCIKGINVKGQSASLSKNVLQNEYAKEIVPGFGAKGMTWMRMVEGRLESNIVQFFTEHEQQQIIQRFAAESGDVLLLIADPSWQLVCSALGQLRLHVAARLNLVPPGAYFPLWVHSFPLFEATEQGLSSNHHPFTMPDRVDFDPSNMEELLSLNSRTYDLVVNGEELGGGSIRINDRALQNKVFLALGLTEHDVEQKFGFFLRALAFGAPPHAGIALGMDRVVAMILNAPSIREVIAFPKNRSAYCPLSEAPSPVSRAQLAELGLLDIEEPETLPGSEQQHDLIESLSWVSRIALTDTERPVIAESLEHTRFLADTVNTHAGDHEPLFSAVPLEHRTREGTQPRICPLAENRQLFKNAPALKGGFFKVASILE